MENKINKEMHETKRKHAQRINRHIEKLERALYHEDKTISYAFAKARYRDYQRQLSDAYLFGNEYENDGYILKGRVEYCRVIGTIHGNEILCLRLDCGKLCLFYAYCNTYYDESKRIAFKSLKTNSPIEIMIPRGKEYDLDNFGYYPLIRLYEKQDAKQCSNK